MTKHVVPIPAVLALWSVGYSAAWIADTLGLPDEKYVQRVLAHGRDIGDRRALVIHIDVKGRPIGNQRAIKALFAKFPNLKTVVTQSHFLPITKKEPSHGQADRSRRGQGRNAEVSGSDQARPGEAGL